MKLVPTAHELALLALVAGANGLDHDDASLNPYCDDGYPLDTFNKCHEAGWLTSRHNDLIDASAVFITEAGRSLVSPTPSGITAHKTEVTE